MEETEQNRSKEAREKVDWWPRADIIAKILSSIVLATIGLALTWSIQNAQRATTQAIAEAQLEAARVKAQDDKKLEQIKFARESLQYFTSKDPQQRKIALMLLEESVPSEVYVKVVQALADGDPSEDVRKAAIARLDQSDDHNVARFLGNISQDTKRSNTERQQALASAQHIVLRSALADNTFIFGPARKYARDDSQLQRGLYTYFLVSGLSGQADKNQDGIITALEIDGYLTKELIAYNDAKEAKEILDELNSRGLSVDLTTEEFRNPTVFVFDGEENTAIWGAKSNYNKIYTLIIGISNYSDPSIPKLAFPANDANSFYALAQKETRAENQILVNATKAEILSAINNLKDKVKPTDLLILYFSGHGVLGKDGYGKWLVTDSKRDDESTWLELADVNSSLTKIKAKTKTIFADSCYTITQYTR